MANQLEITVTNKQVVDFLSGMVARLTDASPLMAGVAQELASQTEMIFQDEGPGWQQLAPATVKRRGNAHPILQVSGALARSFLPSHGSDYAQIASNSPYAAVHFYGGTINIPSRSQQAYFRQNKKTGEVENTFVRKSKSNFAQWVTLPAYSIKMPSRKMLPMDESGDLNSNAAEAIMAMLQAYVFD